MKVADVMSTDVVTATPVTTFKDACDLLVSHGVSALPVVDELGRVIGIVSEADLVPRLAAERHPHTGPAVADVMRTGVVTTRPDADVATAARVMVSARVKRLPVVDDVGVLAGIVSRRDVLGAYLRPDIAITSDVVVALADLTQVPEHHGAFPTVRDGIVTMHGAIDAENDRRVVLAVPWRVPGVVDVIDRLAAASHATA
jgi:CBS domain-containing protein